MDSAKGLKVIQTHLILAIGKLELQKRIIRYLTMALFTDQTE